MKDLPEEERTLVPGPSSVAFRELFLMLNMFLHVAILALLLRDINQEICAHQLDTWAESITMQKREHEEIDHEHEERQKRLRLELLETVR
jgi:hypothetical protein